MKDADPEPKRSGREPASRQRRAAPKRIAPDKSRSGSSAGRGREVVNRVLELVRSGSLSPGDRLPPERELVEIFGIGRPSLRESLRSLEALGIIEARHGGGAFVTDLDARRLLAPLDFYLSLNPSILDDTAECRRLIECEIARKAVSSATAEDLTELDEMIEAHEAILNDPVGFRILDSRFHAKLYSMSRNSMLERIATALYSMGLEQRRAITSNPSLIARSTKEHGLIVDALKAGNEDAVVEAMENHLRHIAESTAALLGGQDSSASKPKA